MKKTTLHTAAMALLMMGGASCATKTSVLGVKDVKKEPIVTKEPTNESTLAALTRKWKQSEEEKKIERKLDVKDMIEYQPGSYDDIVSKLDKSTYPKYTDRDDRWRPNSCVSFHYLDRFYYRDVTKLVQENKEITKKQQLKLLKLILERMGERVRVISKDNDKNAGPKVADKFRKEFYKYLRRTMMKNAGFREDVKSDVGKILKGSKMPFFGSRPSKNPVEDIQKLIDKCD